MINDACLSCGGPLQPGADGAQVCPACAFSFALGQPAAQDLTIGSSIGSYRLVRKVGEGGMGEVWEAEQTEPVRRRVAIKVIKAGMDTRQVIARFEAERQALALMDHPCVSKVFDAGTTEAGRPFFVMEYVAGSPITEHCDRHTLTVAERLDLFLQVCDGVQHAHHKGIIHRDLKPSNVLVAVNGASVRPKIIDFGIAKAVSGSLTERSLFTELGVLIGTPEYMSPEQANLGVVDVDTRTDVYALGAILYELLAGALPHDPQAFREAGFDGILRMVREVEPPPPSARLGSLPGAHSLESARHRSVDPPTLRRQLAGELDWITMKALEKDRARRYESPAAMAEDLERYLRHEPVLAGPPSATYRLSKFVRRHRFGVSVAALAVLAFVGFGIVLTVQGTRIVREAEAKRRVSQFLTELFTVSDPSTARGENVTAREILDSGVEKIQGALEDDPLVKAELLATMGEVYVALGLYTDAEPLLEQALGLRRRWLGAEAPDTLRAAGEFGRVLYLLDRGPEAEALLGQTIEAQKRVLGPEHPETLRAMSTLGRAYWGQNRFPEAEAMLREAFEIQRRVLGPEHVETLRSMHGLGMAIQDRHAEAEALFRETLELRRRVLGPDHPQTLNTMIHLSFSLLNQGRRDDAERVYGEMLAIARRVLGPRHHDTLWSLFNMAGYAADGDRPAEALSYLREAVDNGFSGADALLQNPAFEPLRDDAEFQEIVAAARANAAPKE